MMKFALLFVFGTIFVKGSRKPEKKDAAPSGVKYYHSLDLMKNDLSRDSAYPY